MAEFSGMAGLGGMGVGILAWCHQQIRYEKTKSQKQVELHKHFQKLHKYNKRKVTLPAATQLSVPLQFFLFTRLKTLSFFSVTPSVVNFFFFCCKFQSQKLCILINNFAQAVMQAKILCLPLCVYCRLG